MATSKAIIKASLLSMCLSMCPEIVCGVCVDCDSYCDKMANIIQAAVQSGTVAAGIPCSVDPVTHVGATTGTGTIT